MSTVTTSGTLTPGTGVTLRPPQPVPGLQLAAVLLQNLSGYQLTVSIGGDGFVLPPYMADVFVLPSTSPYVALLPVDTQSSPAGLPAYVNATWFDPSETPDPASYPTNIPAPAFAVGVAVAQELLAQGVPSVLTQDVLADGVAILDATDQTYAVSQYASLSLTITSNFATLPVLFYQFQSFVNPGLAIDSETLIGAANDPRKYRIAVVGPFLRISNNSGATQHFTLLGSNRVSQNRLDARSNSGLADAWVLPAGTYANGQVVPMVQDDSSVRMFGPVFFAALLPQIAVGRLELSVPATPTAPARAFQIITTPEMVLSGTGNVAHFLGAVPSTYSVQFRSLAAQTIGAGGIVNILPAAL